MALRPAAPVLLAAWLILGIAGAHAGPRPLPDEASRLFAAHAPALPPPASALAALSCLAALLSCGFSVALWRRVDTGQEAAKASMYAAGKLFDHAARRFAHVQDEAAGAIESAGSAAVQAGQAASRLAAAARETESRLTACLAEAEARCRDAAALLGRYEAAAIGLPALLTRTFDDLSANAIPAINDAAALLRGIAGTVEADLHSALRALPGRMDEAAARLDAGAITPLQDVARTLRDQTGRLAQTAGALPNSAASLADAAASLADAQARHAELIGRVEALSGLLPGIATSLASTAAGQRQLLSQGSKGMDDGAREMRDAATALRESVGGLARILSVEMRPKPAASAVRLGGSPPPLPPPPLRTAAPAMPPGD